MMYLQLTFTCMKDVRLNTKSFYRMNVETITRQTYVSPTPRSLIYLFCNTALYTNSIPLFVQISYPKN